MYTKSHLYIYTSIYIAELELVVLQWSNVDLAGNIHIILGDFLLIGRGVITYISDVGMPLQGWFSDISISAASLTCGQVTECKVLFDDVVGAINRARASTNVTGRFTGTGSQPAKTVLLSFISWRRLYCHQTITLWVSCCQENVSHTFVVRVLHLRLPTDVSSSLDSQWDVVQLLSCTCSLFMTKLEMMKFYSNCYNCCHCRCRRCSCRCCSCRRCRCHCCTNGDIAQCVGHVLNRLSSGDATF